MLACEVWACAEIKMPRGLKVTQHPWLLLFAFSRLLFFRFSFLIFFSFAEHLVGFIFVRNVFRKAFRILGLDERKGSWVVEQVFHEKFQVNVICFFSLFLRCPWLDWIVLLLVWFVRSLHSAQLSGQSYHWPLKLMTSQFNSRNVDPHGRLPGRLRSEWVEG